jgi:hypothetical protein
MLIQSVREKKGFHGDCVSWGSTASYRLRRFAAIFRQNFVAKI